jgi:hypothetical protein
MQPAFSEIKNQHGIVIKPLELGALPPNPQSHEIAYIIYGPTNPLEMDENEKQYLAKLAKIGYKTNIISAYTLADDGSTKEGYSRAKTDVPKLCKELNIHAIFPDKVDKAAAVLTNDWRDVFFNIFSETIRVKYHPVACDRKEDQQLLERLHDQHTAEVEELARLYDRYRLWHRHPKNEGSILFTHDDYWYTSQTLTDKTKMTAQNYDLITSYKESAGTVNYVGTKLPSSDAPEFMVLSSLLRAQHNRLPRLIVHFHHKLIRDPRFTHLVTEEKIEGGKFASGRKYFSMMQNKATNWFIIREHGVMWVGESVEEFGDFVRQIL